MGNRCERNIKLTIGEPQIGESPIGEPPISFCNIKLTIGASPLKPYGFFSSWVNPLAREMKTHEGFNYLSAQYLKNWDCQHVGVDICAKKDEPVYAIGDGIIIYIFRHYTSKDNLSVIFIEHTALIGTKFIAVYGHCLARPSLRLNNKVHAHEKIGTIVPWGSPVHLHFGINANVNNPPENGWGRLGKGLNPQKYGWRAPSSFLKKTKPYSKFWPFFLRGL